MKTKMYQKIAGLLVVAMLCVSSAEVMCAAEPTAAKEENVYANLSHDGAVRNIYVVNEYTLGENQSLTDYGAYSGVRNITTDAAIETDGDKITLQGSKGKYYYQGDLESKELPWNISITYYLDGKQMSAEELGGRSGKLEIVLSTKKNPKVNETFFKNYLLQGKVVLDTSLCSHITAEGATAASVGSDKQLLYNIMPDKEKEYRITADVTDFRMDGISWSAVPVSFDIDRSTIDTEKLDEKVTDLQDAVTELDDGAIELKDGAIELNDGAYDLHDGAIDLFEGATDLDDGAIELDDGARDLMEGAQELCDGSGSLEKGTNSLRDGLGTLNAKSQELKDGSAQLKNGTDSLVSGIQGAAISASDISAMVQPGIKQGIAGALTQAGVTDPATIETISSGYADQVAAGIGSGMETEITNKMKPLADGAVQLQSGANNLNNGIGEYTGAVTALADGSQQVCDGVGKLRYGISELKDGTIDLKEGTEELREGTIDLVDGAVELYDGTKDLYEGTNDLLDGTNELTDGTDEFKTETSDLDVQVDDEIDTALKKVTGEEFSPISFVSEQNQNVTSVQFAMTTDPIEAPEAETVIVQKEEPSFWQKFVNLFK